jgi:hypothetical protein
MFGLLEMIGSIKRRLLLITKRRDYIMFELLEMIGLIICRLLLITAVFLKILGVIIIASLLRVIYLLFSVILVLDGIIDLTKVTHIENTHVEDDMEDKKND